MHEQLELDLEPTAAPRGWDVAETDCEDGHLDYARDWDWCPVCSTDEHHPTQPPMGYLGGRIHYRCQFCGIGWSQYAGGWGDDD